ncbi:hypothetical protein Hanom_Chr04g00294121 [Helianthus anomalus]
MAATAQDERREIGLLIYRIMSDNVLLVVHSVQVSGFRSLEPRVSDFGSVLIKTTWCLGSIHFLDPILVR